MVTEILVLCLAIATLNQGFTEDDFVLTVESDKLAYSLGETAIFTGRLKNVSQVIIRTHSEVEYCFFVFHDGVEVWAWSDLQCG